jgi:hypothetical protein
MRPRGRRAREREPTSGPLVRSEVLRLQLVGAALLGLAIASLLVGAWRAVVHGARFGLHAVPLGVWMILAGVLPWGPRNSACVSPREDGTRHGL